jgi:hypothetical protein
VNPHEPFNNPNPPEEMSEDFTSLERELRQALRPVDPPAGFADRVIARTRTESAAQPKRARILMFPVLRSRVWIGSAVAAMLLVGVVGEQAHRMEQRRKAEEAQKQFETALQVTDRALEHTRQQLERAGIPFGD